MKDAIKRKSKIMLFSIMFLLIVVLVIVDTYALFETNGSANVEYNVGKWEIKLNNVNISLERVITLNDFVYTGSTHVEDGYFAPGVNAEYELDIDTSNTDTSVEYDLLIDDSHIELYPNIHFKIIDLDTNEELVGNNKHGVISVDSTNKVKKIKVVLEWEDLEEYDESDSTLIGKSLTFNMQANFKQYLGD